MNDRIIELIETKSDEIAISITDAIETTLGHSLNGFPLNIRLLHDEFTLLLANHLANKIVIEEYEFYETERRISEYEMRFL